MFFSRFHPGRRLLFSWWTLSKFRAHVHMFVCSLCLLTGGLWALILNPFFHLCDGRMGNRYGATDVIDKKEDNKLHRNPIQSADFSALERGRIISKTGPLNKSAAANAIFYSLRSSEFQLGTDEIFPCTLHCTQRHRTCLVQLSASDLSSHCWSIWTADCKSI